MNNKNIIIAGAIAIGFYILSQPKKITAIAQKVAQRIRSTAMPTIRKRTAQKVAQKVALPTPHKTTYSSWTPTSWPVRITHKKATLFNYSKPQRKKDLSVLHTAIKWRRALIPPRPKSSIRKALTLNKSSTDRRKKIHEILSHIKYPPFRPRRWQHVAVRRR